MFGMSEWLPMPEVTDPTHQGWFVPPQTELSPRSWPINRNGAIMRGTAAVGVNVINELAAGQKYFIMRNPVLRSAGADTTRRADMYALSLIDANKLAIANDFRDCTTPPAPSYDWAACRGQPDNILWKMYGTVGGAATMTVTLPFIMPSRATIAAVGGWIPDPFEAGNFVNRKVTWALAENIFDTGSRGLNNAFSYQRINFEWLTYYSFHTAVEEHTFIWQAY